MSSDKASIAVYRALVIGKATRQLRQTLGLSQKKLGDLLETDGMNVCRWETGRSAPNEWRSRELAAMATKAGRSDIAGVFVLPPEAWQAPMRDKFLERTLIILQIGAATLRKAEAENCLLASDLLILEALREAASIIKTYLFKQWERKRIAPEFSDGGQFHLWLEDLAPVERGCKRFRDSDESILEPRENASGEGKDGEKADERISGKAGHQKDQKRRRG